MAGSLQSKHVTFINAGDSDSDEEMPSLHSQSDDEDIYLEEFIDSDSDDEVITYHHDPNFNQIEEGDGSNDEPLYGDKEHQVETNNRKELQGASSGFAPEGDAPSPLIDNDLFTKVLPNANGYRTLVIANTGIPFTWQSTKKSTEEVLTSTEEVKILAAQNADADFMWYANREY